MAWPIGLITFVVGLAFAATGFTANHGKPALGSIGFGILVMAGSYLIGIRPGISLRPDGIQVRNPLRTVYLPWTEVADLKAVDVLLLTDQAGRTTRCYAISGSLRTLVRVQKAERDVRERWDAALKDGTSAGTPYYGINLQVWLGLGAVGVGVLITLLGLLGVA